LFNLLENHADARAAAFIDAPSMRKVFDAGARGLAMRARAETVVAWIEKHHEELTTEERAAHDQRDARITREGYRGQALRDAIWIEEDDDQQPSRIVYLDWLMERGYVPPV
jgi:hypothetical protein